jgi:ABC-2 type transport system permease protein
LSSEGFGAPGKEVVVIAMIVKEFRQLRRDHRTLAMMIVLPVLLLVVFGYAASFDVESIPTRVFGPQAEAVADRLPEPFEVDGVDPSGTRADAVDDLRDGKAPVAIVTGEGGPKLLLDGSELFTAKAALASLASTASQATGSGLDVDDSDSSSATAAGAGPDDRVEVLFNEDLETSTVMVPALAGLILLFVGTVITSLGVVRERQAGTLEQLAVMPLRPGDVFLGKIAPYFVVATLDLALVITVGVALFDVPLRGSVLVLGLGALLFLFVTLGLGVLISTVSQNQGQAIQLAMMTLLPQVLLSGLIFPLTSMPAGVRWISYLLPLTYFTEISRGVMVRGTGLVALWQPFVLLAVLGLAAMTLATLRFRRDLAPAPRHRPTATTAAAATTATATGAS